MLEFRAVRSQGDFRLDAEFTTGGAGVTALSGRSGAGKTTIANAIAGLVRPDEGRIRVGDVTLFDSGARIDVPTHERRIGYVFQDGRLFPHMSVRANLAYGMRLAPERRIRLEQVTDLLEIGHLLDRRPGSLSGGEKQRVAMGRALLSSPRLMIMDEPLSSLDGRLKSEVLPFIARLPAELSIPILYVSHSREEIEALAGRLVLVESGRVVAEGDPLDLLGGAPSALLRSRPAG
jgi:molybdate transport system ATP-binding protein